MGWNGPGYESTYFDVGDNEYVLICEHCKEPSATPLCRQCLLSIDWGPESGEHIHVWERSGDYINYENGHTKNSGEVQKCYCGETRVVTNIVLH